MQIGGRRLRHPEIKPGKTGWVQVLEIARYWSEVTSGRLTTPTCEIDTQSNHAHEEHGDEVDTVQPQPCYETKRIVRSMRPCNCSVTVTYSILATCPFHWLFGLCCSIAFSSKSHQRCVRVGAQSRLRVKGEIEVVSRISQSIASQRELCTSARVETQRTMSPSILSN